MVMPKLVIVADTAARIPLETVNGYDIELVPAQLTSLFTTINFEYISTFRQFNIAFSRETSRDITKNVL